MARTQHSAEKRWTDTPARTPFIPYPAIENHGLIGDRRTAALVAADGTLDWLCLPDYDSPIVFGALLDCLKGGFWRLGPTVLVQGQQSYLKDSMVLETRWELATGSLRLMDAMLWPETRRAAKRKHARSIVRRLRCTRGTVPCRFDLQPGYDCRTPRLTRTKSASGYRLAWSKLKLHLWTSRPLQAASAVPGEFELREGEELWTVLELGSGTAAWSIKSARSELQKTRQYWCGWLDQLSGEVRMSPELRQTALSVHLLTYAESGCVVAAPTTSLPERIGGTWNADYRLSWVRDTSLALGILARLGDWEEIELYLRWLVRRESRSGQPLQVLYEVRGGKRPRARSLPHALGYRGSRPVRVGNHAYKQCQFGSFGFLADCMWLYLQEGGAWREEYWRLIRHCAEFVCKHWRQPDNGIWELSKPQHYVHSKVLCWVMLDRAIRIAQRVNSSYATEDWATERSRIHQEVMERGWSERLGAFRQRYEGENLDAAELLISVLEFLPGNHPRVLATIERIAESLTIDGFVYRFNPLETPGVDKLPLGQMEAAFLPCTFWLATAYAKAGQAGKAEAILRRAEQIAGKTALFAEAVDPRTGNFLGNTPLLFSHVEYVRAKLELLRAQQQSQRVRATA